MATLATMPRVLGTRWDPFATRAAPAACRVLSTDATRVSRNLAELAALLKPLGFSPENVKRLVLKQPSLLVANPVTTSAKLEALKVSAVLGMMLGMCHLGRHPMLATGFGDRYQAPVQ